MTLPKRRDGIVAGWGQCVFSATIAIQKSFFYIGKVTVARQAYRRGNLSLEEQPPLIEQPLRELRCAMAEQYHATTGAVQERLRRKVLT